MLSKKRCIGWAAIALLVASSGCAYKKQSVEPYPMYSRSIAAGSTLNAGEGSLFPSDQAILSNEDITRILSARVELPEHARVAVMQLGSGSRHYWSEASPILGHQTTADFLVALKQCPRIAAASALPGILVPERHTVPYLREAAARYQADLLLIYRQDTGSYEKYRATRSDQVKAYCTIEAALLDVRTGTVPFTTVAFEEVSAEKDKEDLNFDETVDKAYHAAESKALQKIAASVVKFLDTAATQAPPAP